MRLLMATLCALLLLVPMAAAQEHEIEVSPHAPAAPVPAGGSMELFADVTMDCSFIVLRGGSAQVDYTFEGLPDGVGANASSTDLDGTDCLAGLPASSLTRNVTVTVTASRDAAGLVPFDFTILASGESLSGSAEGSGTFQDVMVDYGPGHAIDPGDATFEVTGGEVSFNLTVSVSANAKTMVMFEDVERPSGARLDGLKSVTFDVAEGHREEVLPITFKAPSGDWDELAVTFTHVSHCQEGEECDPLGHEEVTWTFTNAGGAAPADDEGDSKESPGPVAGLLVLALVGLALRARRR